MVGAWGETTKVRLIDSRKSHFIKPAVTSVFLNQIHSEQICTEDNKTEIPMDKTCYFVVKSGACLKSTIKVVNSDTILIMNKNLIYLLN